MVAPGSLLGVTGAGGRVGRAFCREAMRRGYRVRGFARHPASLSNLTEAWPLDLERPPVDPVAFAGCDAVVHLAAYVPIDHGALAGAERCWSVNVLGTDKLIGALGAAGVRRLVQTSSANAYAPGIDCPDEDAPLYPVSRTFYLGSKIAQELCAAEACRKHGIGLATLRLSSVYGTEGGGDLVTSFAARLLAGETLTLNAGGHFGADFVLIDDVVSAIFRTLEQGYEGLLNVASGRRTTLAELAQALRKVTGSSEEQVQIISDGPVDEGFPAILIDRLQSLGHQATSLEDGLKLAVNRLSP